MPKPAFAVGRDWRKRSSKSYPTISRRVWYDPSTGYEYEPELNPLKRTWHEIDPMRRMYRDIDPVTGNPVSGGEGQWRSLR